ncbi:protease propeptide/inhibitor [Pholiota conissans]|uniref:Protease propeptide/inhibitor n=1 Tax=Pholiota conissans TaxID=109636 RepID=A0A9P5Z0K6_9AGAR|nr:protease propeptide/inhibitor [Pholiota conissans]
MSTPTTLEKYIVVFKDNATPLQVQQYANDIIAHGGRIFNRYTNILNGFSATIPASFLASLKASHIIEYIEPDGIVTIQ